MGCLVEPSLVGSFGTEEGKGRTAYVGLVVQTTVLADFFIFVVVVVDVGGALVVNH